MGAEWLQVCFGTITGLFMFSSKNIKMLGITFMGKLYDGSICYLLLWKIPSPMGLNLKD